MPRLLTRNSPAIVLGSGSVARDQDDVLVGDVAFLLRVGRLYLLAIGDVASGRRVAIQDLTPAGTDPVSEAPETGWLHESGWSGAYPEIEAPKDRVLGVRVARGAKAAYGALTVREFGEDSVVFDYRYQTATGSRSLD